MTNIGTCEGLWDGVKTNVNVNYFRKSTHYLLYPILLFPFLNVVHRFSIVTENLNHVIINKSCSLNHLLTEQFSFLFASITLY